MTTPSRKKYAARKAGRTEAKVKAVRSPDSTAFDSPDDWFPTKAELVDSMGPASPDHAFTDRERATITKHLPARTSLDAQRLFIRHVERICEQWPAVFDRSLPSRAEQKAIDRQPAQLQRAIRRVLGLLNAATPAFERYVIDGANREMRRQYSRYLGPEPLRWDLRRQLGAMLVAIESWPGENAYWDRFVPLAEPSHQLALEYAVAFDLKPRMTRGSAFNRAMDGINSVLAKRGRPQFKPINSTIWSALDLPTASKGRHKNPRK